MRDESALPPAVREHLERNRRIRRKIRATQAAHALHQKDPEAARRAGEAAADAFPGGRKAWARALAYKRWYGVPLKAWRKSNE